MDNPKISVLIPLYNGKKYAAQCVDSALNQTFQEDYEIIIRDDFSTDGAYEFVKERYAKQISDGKIKLNRNARNLGESYTVNKLINEATGKYFAVLHNDDLYLPYALKHLYQVAELYNADVVHGISFADFFDDDENLRSKTFDAVKLKEVTPVSDNPVDRFNEWFLKRTFWDTQYNLFNRKFMISNEIFNNTNTDTSGDPIFLSLWWIMLAKVFVKTPVIFYLRRNRRETPLPEEVAAKRIEVLISSEIEMSREYNKLFQKVDLFRDNEEIQYMIKAHAFTTRHFYRVFHMKIFENGITPKLLKAVTNAFKKYFGDDYFYPAYIYNYFNVLQFNKSVDQINFGNNSGLPASL